MLQLIKLVVESIKNCLKNDIFTDILLKTSRLQHLQNLTFDKIHHIMRKFLVFLFLVSCTLTYAQRNGGGGGGRNGGGGGRNGVGGQFGNRNGNGLTGSAGIRNGGGKRGGIDLSEKIDLADDNEDSLSFEIKTNPLYFRFGFLNIEFEKRIPNNQAVGLFFGGFFRPNEVINRADQERLQLNEQYNFDQHLLGYYRKYTNPEKVNKGFFYEIHSGVSISQYEVQISVQQPKIDRTWWGASIGGAIGWKKVFGKSMTEIRIGGGYNNWALFYPRVGFVVGGGWR